MRASVLTDLFLCLGAASCASLPVAPTLTVERELHVPGGSVTSLAWSPDGTRLAVGGMAGDVWVIEPSGKAADRLVGREGSDSVMHLCWSADGSHLAVALRRTGLCLYDVAQQRVIAGRSGLRGPIVLRRSQGEFVCLDSGGHPVRIDRLTLADRGRLELPPGGQGNLVALSPDGNQLAVSVTHTCRVFTFDLEAMSTAREIADGRAAVLGLAWPEGATSPWWLDSGTNVLHGFGDTRRVGQDLVVQSDGSRIALLLSPQGWLLEQRDGTAIPLGQQSGQLALHPDGESWANSGSGGIVFGRRGTVDHSRPAPVAFEYVQQGVLLRQGTIAVANGRAPHAFAVANGAAVSVKGLPREGELVRCDQDGQLVWRQDAQVSWWTLDEHAAPVAGRRLEHRFFALPELSSPAFLHGRWLIRGAEALDVIGELTPPPLPHSLGGDFLVPVAGTAPWVAVVGRSLSRLTASGVPLLQGPTERDLMVTDLTVTADGSRIAVALAEGATRVFDVSTGQLLGEAGRFREVRFIDHDTLLGTGFGPGHEAALWTVTGRRLAALSFPDHCQLLDIAPASRRALVAAYGRLLVLSWR